MDRDRTAKIVVGVLLVIVIVQMIFVALGNQRLSGELHDLTEEIFAMETNMIGTHVRRDKRAVTQNSNRGDDRHKKQTGSVRRRQRDDVAFITLAINANRSRRCDIHANQSIQNDTEFMIVRKYKKNFFGFNSSTNAVTVKQDGLYIVHGQMMFYEPKTMTYYGAYVNEDKEPSYRCSISTHKEPNLSATFGTYEQCNLYGVLMLRKGDIVRGKFSAKTPVVCHYKLSFWGVIKLR